MLNMRAERAVAVLWATHLCDEVPDADRVIVLHRGKVLADTTPANLVAAAGSATIEEAFLAMTGRGSTPLDRQMRGTQLCGHEPCCASCARVAGRLRAPYGRAHGLGGNVGTGMGLNSSRCACCSSRN
jgi:ABC-type glutathione transport system ATPase component